MDFLEGLNPQQQQAVTHTDGPLLILAGAGSGKTRVITQRIGYLIRERGVAPASLLAITFTNKAAGEMKQRVERLLAAVEGKGSPQVSTFHSFCVRLLRRDGGSLADLRPGFARDFLIYDDDDQVGLIKSVYKHLELDEQFMPARAALALISRAKNRGEGAQELAAEARGLRGKYMAAVFENYENLLGRANALDFDDLLLETVRLLRHDTGLRQRYGRWFRYVMVDEYQDTNRVQYELMRLLVEEHQNVCAVGDEDQSIYSWRGADIGNILNFERDFPEATVIRLEQNYRSTGTILEAASALVACNQQRKGKWLWTQSGAGEPIRLREAADGREEAEFIASTSDRLLRADAREGVAVLYRTNAQSRPIEDALKRYRRPYVVVGGLAFYQRAEVKDILAYLKLTLHKRDSVSLLRILNTPARGIGKTTSDELQQYAGRLGLTLWEAIEGLCAESSLAARAQSALGEFLKLIELLEEHARQEPPDQFIATVIRETGYQAMLDGQGTPEATSRLENLQELKNAAAEAAARGVDLATYLDEVALIAEADSIPDRAPVLLMTLHNAKGLEFHNVFIAGLEEGLFPHQRSTSSDDMMEEERRLCYVGMTRARRRLFLSWARERWRFGGGGALEPCIPSRFLSEIPAQQIERLRPAGARTAYPGKTYNSMESIEGYFRERNLAAPASQAAAAAKGAAPRPAAGRPKKGLKAGVSVRHPKYGRGTLVRQEGEGEDAKLTVLFPGIGTKKLVVKHAGLTIEE